MAAMMMPGTTVASCMNSSGFQLRRSTPITLAHQSENDVATNGSATAYGDAPGNGGCPPA